VIMICMLTNHRQFTQFTEVTRMLATVPERIMLLTGCARSSQWKMFVVEVHIRPVHRPRHRKKY
jgi:hypothetical protein